MSAQCTTAIALLMSVIGCQGRSDFESVPLIDDQHLPEILVDGRVVAPPPAYEGHRFLRGWWPWRQKRGLFLVPAKDGAWIELVNLSSRPRTLSLDLELLGDEGTFEVEVEYPGGARTAIALADPLEIPLPADLPLGRIPIGLTFPKDPDPVVLEGRLDSAVAPGKVEISQSEIVQGSSSAIDFVRWVEPGTRLRGRLAPPETRDEGGRFSIRVKEDEGDEITRFVWPAGGWRRLIGGSEFDIPLAHDRAGWIRIRLLAEGTGAEVSWQNLRLVGGSAAAPTIPDSQPEPPEPPQLVVLYVLDALRNDFIDLSEPDSSRTPALSRLAQEGVVFTRHQSVAPNTIPSTKSLFTGQVFVTRGHAKLPVDGARTLAEVFRDSGYQSAAFSGNGYVSETYGTARGFEHLDDEVVFREYAPSKGSYNDNAERVHRAALQWLDRLAEGSKAFLYLHTIHPHNPYDPPPPIRQEYAGAIDSSFQATTRNLLDVKHRRIDLEVGDRERIEALYAGAVAYNDAQIENLLRELRQRYEESEILLIVTSDHGEELFDHGGVLHGYTLYEEQLRIPLILSWPGRLTAGRIDLPTVNTDVHETLRHLVDAEPSSFESGRSLWPWILGRNAPADRPAVRFAAASSVKGGIFSAQSDRYKLILAPRAGLSFGMGEGLGRSREPEYVFDLRADPGEERNIAGITSLEVAWLRSLLGAWIERGKLLEQGQEEPTLDAETEKRLRALGYLD